MALGITQLQAYRPGPRRAWAGNMVYGVVSAAPWWHQRSDRASSSHVSACMSLTLCRPRRMHGKGTHGWGQPCALYLHCGRW